MEFAEKSDMKGLLRSDSLIKLLMEPGQKDRENLFHDNISHF